MLALLSILFALCLLGLTVFALHKYQTMEVEFNVDRNMPLPPLGKDSDGQDRNTRIGKAVAKKPQTKATSVDKGVPGKVTPSRETTRSWQDAVTKLKHQGKYQEALQVCKQHLPLWGAYNQICMVLRTELKAVSLTPAEQENRAAQLFQTAAVAEFLHDKSAEQNRLSNNQMRNLELDEINALKFPYSDIGYAHLRLIRKSDIKYMVEFWGRPSVHLSPREYQAVWWQQHIGNEAGSRANRATQ